MTCVVHALSPLGSAVPEDACPPASEGGLLFTPEHEPSSPLVGVVIPPPRNREAALTSSRGTPGSPAPRKHSCVQNTSHRGSGLAWWAKVTHESHHRSHTCPNAWVTTNRPSWCPPHLVQICHTVDSSALPGQLTIFLCHWPEAAVMGKEGKRP